jgi:prolyl-tRNA editing enzyme YbaK/EbsC (Cys-tRNA(Pro) deacylase)
MSNASHERVLATLEGLGVAHEVIEIDPDLADTAAFCEQYGYPPEQAANTIIVASKKKPRSYCTCVVLATSRLDVNHRVKQLMGVSKASFATAEQMQELTGMMVGGVTPLGLPPELPLYVDSRVMKPDWVILGGGGRHLKIQVAPEIFLRLDAQVVQGLGVE